MGGKNSKKEGEDDVFDTNATTPTKAPGRGSIGEEEWAHLSLKKRIKKKKRETEFDEAPKSAPIPERHVPEEIDPSTHVVLRLCRDAVFDISDNCLSLATELKAPTKSPAEIKRLTHQVALLDLHVATVVDALAPLVRHDGARIDLEFNDQTLIVLEETAASLEAVRDAQVPESTIAYVGYVATYFVSTDLAETTERLTAQRKLFVRSWNRSFKALVGRLERQLTLDDSRLAELERYSEHHGVDLPREYFALVKAYDSHTKDLLHAIHVNTKGMKRLRRKEELIEKEEQENKGWGILRG